MLFTGIFHGIKLLFYKVYTLQTCCKISNSFLFAHSSCLRTPTTLDHYLYFILSELKIFSSLESIKYFNMVRNFYRPQNKKATCVRMRCSWAIYILSVFSQDMRQKFSTTKKLRKCPDENSTTSEK